LEQDRRGAAHRDDVAADGLQVVRDLLDPREGVLEGLPVAAAKADEGRHDLDPLGSPIVPKMKALTPVRRLSQPNARAPRKHGAPPAGCRRNFRCGYAISDATRSMRRRRARRLVAKAAPCL